MEMNESRRRLAAAYALESESQLLEQYDSWADVYDADLASYGYRMPPVVTGLIVRHIPDTSSPILDAGSGTGILGEGLHVLGYSNVTALDISEGMLRVAANKGIYRATRQMALGEHLDFPNDCFACIAAMGVLTVGHAPPSSLDELVRITRPGGVIIFSMLHREPVESDFRRKQDDLERRGLWRLAEDTSYFQSLPYGEPDVSHKVYVYRVL